MVRGGISLLPHLGVGLFLSILFVAASVCSTTSPASRYGCGVILVIFGVVVSPMLAVSTTFGIVGLLNLHIYPIEIIIPFLVLAIGLCRCRGVDDAP